MSQPFKPYQQAPFYADPMTGEPRRPFGPKAPQEQPRPLFSMDEDQYSFAVSSARNAFAALDVLMRAAATDEPPTAETVARTAEYARYLVGCVVLELRGGEVFSDAELG